MDGVTPSNLISPAGERQLPLRVSIAFTASRRQSSLAFWCGSPAFRYDSQRFAESSKYLPGLRSMFFNCLAWAAVSPLEWV